MTLLNDSVADDRWKDGIARVVLKEGLPRVGLREGLDADVLKGRLAGVMLKERLTRETRPTSSDSVSLWRALTLLATSIAVFLVRLCTRHTHTHTHAHC